jgi:endo-1,4-beta-xylanase
VQINDATNGARTGIRNWASDTNMGYQSTADYGIIVLQ